MADITVHPIPSHKRRGACDAGALWQADHGLGPGTPRTKTVIGDDGLPVLGDDGKPVVMRVRRPPSQKWVSMSGHIINARMTDGSGDTQRGNRHVQVTERLHRDGAIRYGDCPLRNPQSIQWLPKPMRNMEPCEPGTYGERKACKHVEQVISERRAAHEAREKLVEERSQSEIQQQLREGREQHVELVSALTEAISTSRKRNG